jgi:hypothetical protein
MEEKDTEEMLNIKYQTFVYKFNQNIEVVWDFVKDMDKTYKVLSDLRSETIFTKGNNSYEVGAEFNITWGHYRRLFSKVEEVKETDFHKMLVYEIESEPTYQKFKFIYNLFKTSVDDSTILKLEFKYEGEGLKIQKQQQEYITQERLEMMKRIENHLNTIEHEQFESITLNCRLKHLWKVITNWKVLFKLVPKVGEECIHDNDFSLEVGKTFRVIWSLEKCLASTMKIIKVNFDETNNLFEFSLLNSSEDCKFPLQEIHFKITQINKDYCFLEYKHKFLDPVKKEYISKITESKRNMLTKLKKALKGLYSNFSKQTKQPNLINPQILKSTNNFSPTSCHSTPLSKARSYYDTKNIKNNFKISK